MITGKEEIDIKLSYTEIGYLINCTQYYQRTGKRDEIKPYMLETMKKLKNARMKITKKNEEDNLP